MDEALLRIGLFVIGIFIGKEIGVRIAIRELNKIFTHWTEELKKGLEEKKA